MPHRLIAYFVCMALAAAQILPRTVLASEQALYAGVTEAELLAKYPGAKIIHTTPEHYAALEKELRQRGYRQAQRVPLHLASNGTENKRPAGKGAKNAEAAGDPCAGTGNEAAAGAEANRILVDFSEDLFDSGKSSSSEEAAVLFIVIGTIVLVVWALYVVKYIYDVTLGFKPCGRWDEFTVVTNSTSTSDDQHARFEGLRYATGFRDGAMEVGISFELGQADILLTEVASLELKGRYWLTGPALRWRLSEKTNPDYFLMNFTAGTTEHSEVGLLAKASLGLVFGIGDAVQLGLNWGVLNINLDEDQGIISERHQYHYLYGLNVGFRF